MQVLRCLGWNPVPLSSLLYPADEKQVRGASHTQGEKIEQGYGHQEVRIVEVT